MDEMKTDIRPPWDAPGYLDRRREFIGGMREWFNRGRDAGYIRDEKYQDDLDVLIPESAFMQAEYRAIGEWLHLRAKLQGYRIITGGGYEVDYDDSGEQMFTPQPHYLPHTKQVVEVRERDLHVDSFSDVRLDIALALDAGDDPLEVAARFFADIEEGCA